MKPKRAVIIGAGIGGLTAAALLLHAGCEVTVLEAQAYPGGSAGTFFHKGHRFDAGATLAGGFAPGGPHARLADLLGLEWPVHPADPAWVTHLPGLAVTQWTDRSQWRDEHRRAFPGSDPFWRKQEWLAAASWDLASRPFPWPPSGPADLAALLKTLTLQHAQAAPYAFLRIGQLLPGNASSLLRAFLDASLIISAQSTSRATTALYAAAALDLPRRGVNLVRGGMGGLAETLVNWIRAHGGTVHFRQQVTWIQMKNGRAACVQTKKGLEIPADVMVANLTPIALDALLGHSQPVQASRGSRQGWGAFTLYLGVEEHALRGLDCDHHQVVVDPVRPLGEGNSVFISLSDRQDSSRAPAGMRSLTLSTHTDVEPWWRLLANDPAAYAARKEDYTQRVLAAAEIAIPSLRAAARLCLPGTPVTFQFYTGRPKGLVGGFPQTSLFSVRGPRTRLKNLFLVGDSIFPGQSTAGVTLGAFRAAAEALNAG